MNIDIFDMNVIIFISNGGEKMKKLIVEINDDLHKCVRRMALEKSVSIKQYITELIKKDLQKKE